MLGADEGPLAASGVVEGIPFAEALYRAATGLEIIDVVLTASSAKQHKLTRRYHRWKWPDFAIGEPALPPNLQGVVPYSMFMSMQPYRREGQHTYIGSAFHNH